MFCPHVVRSRLVCDRPSRGTSGKELLHGDYVGGSHDRRDVEAEDYGTAQAVSVTARRNAHDRPGRAIASLD